MHVNLTAYNDVENLSRFTEESFSKYCSGKLESCGKHTAFIRKHLAGKDWGGRVCEIGSGSGKLLFRLEKEGLLSKGFGYEVSASRCAFAEKFKVFAGSPAVEIIHRDIIECPPQENLDMVIGVDIVLQLIGPIAPNYEPDILKWAHRALRKGGFVVFELMDFQYFSKCVRMSKHGEYRFWEEFPETDPFECVLAKFSFDKNQDLVWAKKFFRRNSPERSEFVNILRPYSRKKAAETLEKAGFKNCRVHKKWDKDGDVDEGGYIITAQK